MVAQYKHMRITAIAVLLIMSFGFARAEKLDVLALLKSDLGKAIEVHGVKEIWYCPDNTCELYKIDKANPDFPGFVYLYLYYESGYIYLKESFDSRHAFRQMAKEEPRVSARVAHYCKKEHPSPTCIIDGMRKKLKISVGFGRYDEVYFCYGFKENENICTKR